jgi:flagellar basal-body rod modification protein FlgD
MQLLATQFQEQDPLQPMDDTAFIAQTAQFTALQQATTLTQQVTQMAANGYIGRQVSVNNAQGQTAYGTVTGVDTSGATPNLIINGAEYPLSNLLGIQPPPAAATPTTPTSTPTKASGS